MFIDTIVDDSANVWDLYVRVECMIGYVPGHVGNWYLCITTILDLLTQPHRSSPWVHIGLSVVFYMTILFSSDRGELSAE